MATGFAGAIAIARRDVAAVLPGRHRYFSVPPLAVVGICAGQGAFTLATGALVLFLSNILAMVMAGTWSTLTLATAARLRRPKACPGARPTSPSAFYFVLAAVPLLSEHCRDYLLSV